MFKRIFRSSYFIGALACIGYGAIVARLFWSPLVQKFGSIQWDAVTVHFYNLFFSANTWQQGILPLWTPHIFNGFPQIADPQVAFWYPINLLLASTIGITPDSMMLQVAMHYFLAALFAFYLARHLSGNTILSFGIGGAYAFGGFMIGHASHVGMLNTATWLPLALLFMSQAIHRPSLTRAVLGGLVYGIAFLAGHFQMALYSAVFIALYGAFLIISKFDRNAIKNSLRHIVLFGIFFAVAGGTTAIQLLPTAELAGQSQRAEIPLEVSQTESLEPGSLRGVYGFNHNNVAFGGYAGPWDRTQNYLYLGSIIIVLAAVGFILSMSQRKTRIPALFFVVAGTVGLFYSFGKYSLVHEYIYQFVPFFNKIRAPGNMMLIVNVALLAVTALGAKAITAQFKQLENWKFSFLWIAISLGILYQVLPAAQSTDLLFARMNNTSVTHQTPLANTIIREYQSLNEIERFSIFRVPGFESNFSQVVGIKTFDGYNPLALTRQGEYTDAMVVHPQLIDAAGIKYLPCEFISTRIRQLSQTNGVCINNAYFPRISLRNGVVLATDSNDALEKVTETDLRQNVIIEDEEGDLSNQPTSQDTNSISLLESSQNRLSFSVTTMSHKTIAVINQAFYPGWVAQINGESTKLYRANYYFQGLVIPKGTHTVELHYKPKMFYIGAVVTLLTLLVALVLIILDRKKNGFI